MKNIRQLVAAGLTATPARTEPVRRYTASAAWRRKWLRLDESQPEVLAMTLAVELFAKRCICNDRHGPTLLVIGGCNGTGKSHAAQAVVEYVERASFRAWQEGWWPTTPRSLFVPWADLANTEDKDRRGRWDDIQRAGLVALDDVGSETDRYRSALPVENLARMLNARERQWSILTTNWPPARWATVWDKRVEDRLWRHALHVELKETPGYFRHSLFQTILTPNKGHEP